MSYPHPGTVPCPYCGIACECDEVDIGIGYQQCGPYYCDACGASQIGPGDNNEATPEEKKMGWYGPHRPVSDQANTFQGRLVSHVVAKSLYRFGILDPKPEPQE